MPKTGSPPKGKAGSVGRSEGPADPVAPVDRAPGEELTPAAKAAEVPAPVPVEYDADFYRAMSRADELQIAQEIQGNAPKAMLYSFRQKGSQVLGLSWKGVREAVRQINTRGLGRIGVAGDVTPTFEEVTIDVDTGLKDDDGRPILEKREAVRVTVLVRDEQHGGSGWGTATQTKEMKLKQKDKKDRPIWQPDPFAATKALSKAQRNALEPFVPLELVEELKEQYKGTGSVDYIEGTAHELPDLPPPLDDELAKEKVEQIRKLYADFKKKDPEATKKLTPGQFNRFLDTAQRDSHERLDDFIAHLTGLIEGSEEK